LLTFFLFVRFKFNLQCQNYLFCSISILFISCSFIFVWDLCCFIIVVIYLSWLWRFTRNTLLLGRSIARSIAINSTVLSSWALDFRSQILMVWLGRWHCYSWLLIWSDFLTWFRLKNKLFLCY
jgi:hypothetical protein